MLLFPPELHQNKLAGQNVSPGAVGCHPLLLDKEFFSFVYECSRLYQSPVVAKFSCNSFHRSKTVEGGSTNTPNQCMNSCLAFWK